MKRELKDHFGKVIQVFPEKHELYSNPEEIIVVVVVMVLFISRQIFDWCV